VYRQTGVPAQTSGDARAADALMMKDQATKSKNIVESAHPRPAESDRLSEDEKKALELSGRIEHTVGEARTRLHDASKKLGGRVRR
jgi:hypothetical protein